MGNVNPQMWDDDRFVDLPYVWSKVLWTYLLTCTQEIPGLIRGGVGSFAEALRVSDACAKRALGGLIEAPSHAGLMMIEVDPLHRIVRVPNAPRYNPPGNPNVVVGWWRRWQQMPDSVLKHRHVGAIKTAIDRLAGTAEDSKEASTKAHEAWIKVWTTTFDLAKSPSEDKQESLFPSHLLKASRKPSRRNVSGTGSETGSGTRSETEIGFRNPDPDPSPDRLPFTVGELLLVLGQKSAGQVVIEPFDRRLAPAITKVIRQCAAENVTLDDVEAAAAWIGAGGLAWMSDLDPRWVAKAGNLFGAVGAARRWIGQGRPVIAKSNVVPLRDVRYGRYEPPTSFDGVPGEQKLEPIP